MARKVVVVLSSCEGAKGLIVDAWKSLVAVVFDFLLGVAVKVIPDLATLHRTRIAPLQSQLRSERELSENFVPLLE